MPVGCAPFGFLPMDVSSASMPHGRRVGYRLPSDNMAAGINLSIPHLELSIVWRLWVPLVSSVLLGLFTRWASHRYDTPRPPWGSSLGLLYLILLSSAWSCQFEVTDFLQPLLFYVPWIPTSRPYRGLRLVRVNPPPADVHLAARPWTPNALR